MPWSCPRWCLVLSRDGSATSDHELPFMPRWAMERRESRTSSSIVTSISDVPSARSDSSRVFSGMSSRRRLSASAILKLDIKKTAYVAPKKNAASGYVPVGVNPDDLSELRAQHAHLYDRLAARRRGEAMWRSECAKTGEARPGQSSFSSNAAREIFCTMRTTVRPRRLEVADVGKRVGDLVAWASDRVGDRVSGRVGTLVRGRAGASVGT